MTSEPHTRPMDFTGRPMGGFVVVNAEGLDGGELERWVAAGREFAQSLPTK